MGALEVCIDIANDLVPVPRSEAASIVRELFAPPTVYNAVADRIGLLPHPDSTVQFYMRIEEVKASAAHIEAAVKYQWTPGMGPVPLISGGMILPIADALFAALLLARPIVADAKSGPLAERLIRETTVQQIDECLKAAKGRFPEAAIALSF